MNKDNTQDIRIERTLNAPAEKVWEMWTVPSNFQKWYGPTGAQIPTAEMDLATGGKRFICMEVETPGGIMQMWFIGEFLEVQPITLLSYTESMCDESGELIPPAAMGLPADHPEVTTVTVELTAVGETTKMVMTHAGVPAGSPGEMGWNMAFDTLANTL